MKNWTVMVWIAGDNNLEDAGNADLAEMKKVGSTDALDVVAQFDRMSTQHTLRYHLSRGGAPAADQVADLGPTDTGDPAVAIDFFTWAMRTYPARHYLAILWNHGGGIDETDVYRRAVRRGARIIPRGRPAPGVLSRPLVRVATRPRPHQTLFNTTVEKAVTTRGIAYDDSSKDFLDNQELKRVLSTIRKRAGRKLDIVGFDACLMNMVEVAYSIRLTAGFVVGSEEAEPGEGWPYDAVLKALAAQPTLTPRELGALIVARYVRSYTSGGVTQSLLDLARAPAVAGAVDGLARRLKAALKDATEFAHITRSLNGAQHYDFKDFIDLGDLCRQLTSRTKNVKIRQAAADVVAALSGPSPFVAAEGHRGAGVADSHGASIYFPRGDISVIYDKLDFARATAWGEFIHAYLES